MFQKHSLKRFQPVCVLIVFGIALFLAHDAIAANAKKGEAKVDKTCSDSVQQEEMLPVDHLSVTEHKLRTADFELSYQAVAGALPIRLENNGPECRIFFVGYQVHGGQGARRPLTFVFNGGPGASSAYLHLGALGPERVILDADGSLPGPPAQLVDNLETWLRFTDLVFVDPVGTGYSRCWKKNGEKATQKIEGKAWGVKEDLKTLAAFIRLYLTRNNRWLSPRFLVGESYGGFRVAALADVLQNNYDIALNGVVLLSPSLEFELLRGNEFSLLPWVARLPSLAATARYHGKAVGPLGKDGDIRQSLQDVERFAVEAYLPALAKADTEVIQSRLANFIGLPAQRLAQLNARVSPRIFSKELLRQEGRLVSLYDGSVTAIDPDPASPFPPGKDPLLVQLNTLLAAAFNGYVREQLKFETDIPYEILNVEVAHRWDWRSGLDGPQGYVGVAGNLKNAMSLNQQLRVFIAHGIFDLVTPYFGSVLITDQMALDPAIVSNLQLKVYPGGHMFYTHDKARQQFYTDVRQFYLMP